MGNFIITLGRFLLAILIAPIVIACAINFQSHLASYPGDYKEFFMWGAFAFLLTFLFLYQFWGVYEFGQKITNGIFKFLAPLDKLVAYFIPVYFTLIMVAFYITKIWFKIGKYTDYFIFFAGFALALHILLTAQNLQEEEKTPIKPSYLFLMNVTFIINIFIAVLLFDLIARDFTFPEFFKSIVNESTYIYITAFEKLFS